MRSNKPCAVCASPYTLYVQDVIGRRTGKKIPQFACLDCQSFMNPSGYMESPEQKGHDFDALMSYKDGHSIISSQLCLEIVTKLPGAKTALEIGFGLGLFMKSLRDYGLRPYGFEVNRNCVDFAQNILGLDCECGYFDETHTKTYDFISACMVFEHLENPRDLFKLMASRLNRDGAIYLSVPFIHRNDWRFLWTADTEPGDLPDIFCDNDVHITHFSVEGMKRMGLSLGARSAEYWVSKDTYRHSPGSYHGVLFRF